MENPTQLRVRRWSFNCKELLVDPTGVREFMKFCQADFSTESLNFYLNVQEVRNCPLSVIKQKADFVYRFVCEEIQRFHFHYLIIDREHLAPNAAQEVNINDTIRIRILKHMDHPDR